MKDSMGLRTLVLVAIAFISTSAFSWDYIGESGKFDRFIEDSEQVSVNQRASAIKIVATKRLHLEYCEIFFGNGNSRYFDVGMLSRHEQHVIRLRQTRRIRSIKCLGTSEHFMGSRAQIQVFTEQIRRPAPQPRRPRAPQGRRIVRRR